MAYDSINRTMFPRTNPNFTTGRYMPPSKNIDQQRLFQRPDPYAKKPIMGIPGDRPWNIGRQQPRPVFSDPRWKELLNASARREIVPRGPGGEILNNYADTQHTFMPDIRLPPQADGPAPVLTPPAAPNYNALSEADYYRYRQMTQPGLEYGEQNPLADAAKLVGGSVEGNPFLTHEARASLNAGLLPQLNSINPQFYRYTSPVIQQALSGLLTSGGVRPEEQEFLRNMWRPQGM